VVKFDLDHIKGWLDGNKYAIDDVEQVWRYDNDDLIQIREPSRSWIRTRFERSCLPQTRLCQRLVGCEPNDVEKAHGNNVYFIEDKVERWSQFIMAGVGLSFIIAPLWVLWAVGSSLYRLIGITLFTITFFVISVNGTTKRTVDVVAAAAAYAAVLMVFMQIPTKA
jgi:hypothetical protein